MNTSAAAVTLIKYTLKRFEGRNGVTLSLYDLSTAFDLVLHDLLLYKLEHYGFAEKHLRLLKNYLEGWNQIVEYSGQTSQAGSISRGTKQGSILFVILINDLP